MTGVLWAIAADEGFGLFQSCNRRAGRSVDPCVSTFSLLLVSAVILVLASAFTEDLSLLRTTLLRTFAYFGLAGIVHFLLGWTLLSMSQARIGAARTGALIGTTPLFAFIVGLAVF